MLMNSNRATSLGPAWCLFVNGDPRSTSCVGVGRWAMGVVVASPPWMYREMLDGSMVAGRWLTLDAERWAMREVVASPPWMYREMLGGSMVAG